MDDIQVHAFTIFTKLNDSYYHFTYYAIPQTFSKYLDDFKKIINSLEFVSTDNETNKKQPSFISEIEENNNSTLIFIDKNENQDLLNTNNKKQKQQEKHQQEQVLKQQQQQQNKQQQR